MKKSQWIMPVVFMALGAACLAAALLLPEGRNTSILFGLGGGWGIGAGLMPLCRAIYWSRPSHAQAYQERQKEMRVSMKDERKIFLRARAGQIAYQLMWIVLPLLMFVCTLAHAPSWVTLMLLGLWIFLWASGQIAYHMLAKRL